MPPRMKTSYFLAAAAGLQILAGVAAAQKPDKPGGPPAVALLLDTFKVVEGTFTTDPRGNYVRGSGDATQVIPAASVLFVGTSRDDVSKYLAGRAAVGPALPAKFAHGDFNTVAAKAFPTKVQPILTNLCASCHAKPDYAGTFKLKAIPTGFADADAARANLIVAFAHLDRAKPSASELVAKCVAAHGGQKSPACRDRTHPAATVIELWANSMAQAEGTPTQLGGPPLRPGAVSPPADAPNSGR